MSAHTLTRMARGERGLVYVPPRTGKRPPQGAEARMRMGATHLGISFEDYRAYVEAGQKWCTAHRAWEPRSLFGVSRKAPDGLSGTCKEGNRLGLGLRKVGQ